MKKNQNQGSKFNEIKVLPLVALCYQSRRQGGFNTKNDSFSTKICWLSLVANVLNQKRSNAFFRTLQRIINVGVRVGDTQKPRLKS